jgi:HAD superfamily hydrolase (TIGR01509 family)
MSRVAATHAGNDTVDLTTGPRLDLVIFDLDGVLVDTQWAEDAALGLMAERLGLRLTPTERHAWFNGQRIMTCIERICDAVGAVPPPDATAIVRAECERLLEGQVEALPGVAAALEAIPYRKAVASNSPLDIIRARVTDAGLAKWFGDSLFSAYDIGAWKPDPALFLHAASHEAVEPARCLVIEDSDVGVEAALAAGMCVLHFAPVGCSGSHVGCTPFDSMELLPTLTRQVAA